MSEFQPLGNLTVIGTEIKVEIDILEMVRIVVSSN